MRTDLQSFEIPGAHILPCPECGVPIDAADFENWIRLQTAACIFMVCQSCKAQFDSSIVIGILEKKDGKRRELIGKYREGLTYPRSMDVWVQFEREEFKQ